MSNNRIARTCGLAAVAFLAVVFATSNSSAQFQPKGTLGVLAPDNLAKARPKPAFDLTGTWLHSGNERFEPPATVKLTPAAQKHFDAAKKATAEGKIYRNDIGLCWPAGVPIMMTRVWPIYMVQLPTSVFMIQELMNSVRVLYLDGRQHTDADVAVRSFNGESVGRWEGNAMVIETRNFVDEHHSINDRMGVPASDELRIIERYTMPNPNSLQIEFTLIDPKGWEGEWKTTKTWRRVTDRDLAEVVCLPDLNEHMPTVHSKDNVREDVTKKD
jgi:hypothetical protein